MQLDYYQRFKKDMIFRYILNININLCLEEWDKISQPYNLRLNDLTESFNSKNQIYKEKSEK